MPILFANDLKILCFVGAYHVHFLGKQRVIFARIFLKIANAGFQFSLDLSPVLFIDFRRHIMHSGGNILFVNGLLDFFSGIQPICFAKSAAHEAVEVAGLPHEAAKAVNTFCEVLTVRHTPFTVG